MNSKHGNIRLRAVEPQDLELLYLWENDPALWETGNTRQPYSRYALKEYINQQLVNDIYENLQLRLMITESKDEVTVGTVDLFDFDIHNSRIALGLYIDTNYRGKGYAREALHLIEEYVFGFLKINQLYCHIASGNTASRTMFEKEQYQSGGILRNWIKTQGGFEDVIVFQRFIK